MISYAAAKLYTDCIGASTQTGLKFEQGTVPFHFNNLTCNGSESNILQCAFSGGTMYSTVRTLEDNALVTNNIDHDAYKFRILSILEG